MTSTATANLDLDIRLAVMRIDVTCGTASAADVLALLEDFVAERDEREESLRARLRDAINDVVPLREAIDDIELAVRSALNRVPDRDYGSDE